MLHEHATTCVNGFDSLMSRTCGAHMPQILCVGVLAGIIPSAGSPGAERAVPEAVQCIPGRGEEERVRARQGGRTFLGTSLTA